MPLLLTLLFGDSAPSALRGASGRLLAWCRAFDEYMAGRRRTCTAHAVRRTEMAWQRLLRQTGKMPWELEPADIQAHAAWMREQGFASSTITSCLGHIRGFYRWCGQRRVDPLCGPGFNPAAGLPWRREPIYARLSLLSRAEIAALLGVLARDTSLLGRRDYAYFLARLRLGAPVRLLLRLQWGQIEQDGERAWVRWRPQSPPFPLPAEVWQAVRTYLEASGRLAGMRPEKYVFPPCRHNNDTELTGRPEEWHEDRCQSHMCLLSSLKLYGRLAGIPDEKLTMEVLRFTAIRLRLDAGDSLEQMRAFMDSGLRNNQLRYILRRLPQLPPDEGPPAAGAGEEPPLPVRTVKPLQGELIHGFFARSQPPEAVQAILAERIEGLDEQVCGLRILGRGLLERHAQVGSAREAALLGQVYAENASRLAVVIQTERMLEISSEDREFEDRMLVSENTRRRLIGLPRIPLAEFLDRGLLPDGENGLHSGGSARMLREEIASIRCVLRRTFLLALETPDNNDYARLVHLYGQACIRLVRLLKATRARRGLQPELIAQALQGALEILEEEKREEKERREQEMREAQGSEQRMRNLELKWKREEEEKELAWEREWEREMEVMKEEQREVRRERQELERARKSGWGWDEQELDL